MNDLNWEREQKRFMTMAYPRIVKAAKQRSGTGRAATPDASRQSLGEDLGPWRRLLLRGRDPEPMLACDHQGARSGSSTTARSPGGPASLDIHDYRAA